MTSQLSPEFREQRRSQLWWDLYHLRVAREIAAGSKDPSTKVGAVIVRPDRTVAATGYNGFPRGIADTAERLNDRDVKYGLVVHGEINAILTAREPLHGYTLYTWPFLTCERCALHVIQAGIKRVVAPTLDEERRVRWKASLDAAQAFYAEAGVACEQIDVTPVEGIG
ncbi:deoxycytidylate deaminase [Bradyrhizobium diazoefficiens]|nr:deoxycytidylate deaminase [Bradyrhizobium diazoefficiens]BCF70331.1 deoxycytidylate deaminase [Bradyrhizobium diazoefficiens]